MVMQGRRPTVETAAATAGVSWAIVSHVMNGSPNVRLGVWARVEEAARELGYVTDGAARALAGRYGSAAIVIREPDNRAFYDPWFGEVAGAHLVVRAST